MTKRDLAVSANALPSRSQRNCGRQGFQVLELLFALPVMLLLLAALLGYGKVLMTRGGLAHAVTVGAREAAKGGNLGDVVEAVNEVLAAYQMVITEEQGSGLKLAVQEGPDAIAEYGDPNVWCQPSPWVGPKEVCVTVWVDYGAIRGANLTPISYGSSLMGCRRPGLLQRCLAKKEQVGRSKPCGGFLLKVACRD